MKQQDLSPQEARLVAVVMAAYLQPFRTKSDFAREHADYVAIAASIGLISVAQGAFTFTRDWRVTAKGIRYLQNLGVLPHEI